MRLIIALALLGALAASAGHQGKDDEDLVADVEVAAVQDYAAKVTSAGAATERATNLSWQQQVDNLTSWDYGRFGGLGLIVLIMTLNYGPPIFGRQSDIVSPSRINIADPETDAEEVWKNLHSTGRVAAIEMATLWVLLMVVRSLLMVGLQPNCNQTICKSMVFTFLSWQPVWYLGMLGRVDDPLGGFQRDWQFILKKETIMEISLSAIFIWLGWFTPSPPVPTWQAQVDSLTNWDYGRMVALGLIALIMTKNYVIPIWGTHSNILEFCLPAGESFEKDTVWNSFHPNAKIATIEMAALWGQMLVLNTGVVLFYQPNCVQTLTKFCAVMFVCWWPVWTLGCLGRVDDHEEVKRDFMFYVKKEMIMEAVLCGIFSWLGFFAP